MKSMPSEHCARMWVLKNGGKNRSVKVRIFLKILVNSFFIIKFQMWKWFFI